MISISEQNSLFDTKIEPNLAPCNLLVITVNVLLFLLSDLFTPTGNEFFLSAPDSPDLITLGACSWTAVLQDGEWYRLLTAMFLHLDIDHIFNNMVVLLFIGTYFELLLGKIPYLAVYFSSGLIAGITSMVYNMLQNNEVVAVGASGAIFGMMGGLVCIILVRMQSGDRLDLRRILVMVFLSLYSGLTSEGVDNAAHIGGFVAGFVVTIPFVLSHRHRKAGTDSC